MAKIKIFRNIFKFRGFFESLKLAAKGIAYLFLFHRNMRIIFMSGILAFLLGLYLGLRGIEFAILCVTIAIVFIAEIFNTAIELMINMFTDKYNTVIRLVKDIAAAVVLIASLNSIAVGIILFYPKIILLLKTF